MNDNGAFSESDAELFWELFKKPIAMVMVNEEADADILWMQWDFDNRGYVWKMDVLTDLSNLIDAKIEQVREQEKRETLNG